MQTFSLIASLLVSNVIANEPGFFSRFKQKPVPVNACKVLVKDVIEDCGGPDDVLTIGKVTLNPSMPRRGESFTMNIIGMLNDQIQPGDKLKLVAKRGFLTKEVVNDDLCNIFALEETADDSNLSCPLQPGFYNKTVTGYIPYVPHGLYTGRAIATAKDSRQIFNIKLSLNV